MDIARLLPTASAFKRRLREARQSLPSPGFEWYPHDTLSALWHMDRLLTGANRDLLAGHLRILDLGSQDGELAFFLESLGHQVVAVDHPAYNHNGMRGIRALKTALGSAVEIHEIDLDRPFTLPHDTYDLAVFLGVLYHLRNPFYVLEELARRSRSMLLSTRVARRFPDGAPMPHGVPLAYLLRENELNRDDSNYFIFSEPGLRVMLERAHWDAVDFRTFGDTLHSDPIQADRDERAFCFARTRHHTLANLELLDGWHDAEETGWRWTERRFGVRVKAASVLTMRLYVAGESIRRLGRLTLAMTANGAALEPAVYDLEGAETLVRALPETASEEIELRFELDRALSPEESDSRERGIIVASISVEAASEP